MPRRISKKVSKIMDASALEKFKDTQAKNEHFERYNKETDKAKKLRCWLKQSKKVGCNIYNLLWLPNIRAHVQRDTN